MVVGSGLHLQVENTSNPGDFKDDNSSFQERILNPTSESSILPSKARRLVNQRRKCFWSNGTLQADPTGDFIRHFVPELAHVKGKGRMIIPEIGRFLTPPFKQFMNLSTISAQSSLKGSGIQNP